MCVGRPRGEENRYTELTLEGYLDMAAMSYCPKSLRHWKMWPILQREWPWPHTWWQGVLPKEAHNALRRPNPGGATLSTPRFSVKEQRLQSTGRQGRAGAVIPHSWTEEAVNEWITQHPEDTEGNKRCHKAVLLLKGVLTFKRTEEDPGSAPLPWLLQEVCYGGRATVFYLHYQPSVCTEHWVTHFFVDLRGKDLAPHHYKWSIFFSKKCPLFLWKSPPQLCRRLRGE